jgi:ADP-heptose:LPS heptosyltransferase
MKKRQFSWKDPKPAKTAAVVRYAAIGDAIQTSSIFPLLKAEGYHLTVYCMSGPGYEIIKHDPNVDRFIIQGKDQVHPRFLQEFWDDTKIKYDKWINLCESIEGTLLAMPGRANFEWPDSVRAKYMNRNYLEWTHDLAELPHVFNPKFYSTLEEKAWARKTANRYGRRNILWSLAGSSGHKAWPWLDAAIARIMLEYDDVAVTLVGDELCKKLEEGWEKEPRVHCKSGVWSIRESASFAEAADLIIGTETGLLNAAGGMEVPKIITMSHSSEEMLTKHWKNVIALKQKSGCPKFPCRQLHYTWDYCMQDKETGTAVCQSSIDVDMMWDAIVSVLGVQNRIAA